MSKKPEKPKTAKAPARAPKQRRARAITEAEFAAMDFEPWQEGGWFQFATVLLGSQALRRDHTQKTTMNIMMAVVIGSA